MTGWNIFLEEMKEKRGGGKKGEKRASNHTFLGGGCVKNLQKNLNYVEGENIGENLEGAGGEGGGRGDRDGEHT